MISSRILFGGLVLLVGVSLKGMFSSGESVSSLSEEMKGGIIAEFRTMVEKLNLPHEYMKDDAYLLRYLTAKDFNLKEALENFQRVLAAREELSIDSIFDEGWVKRFPYSISSVGKEGRPILYYAYGKMDISEIKTRGIFKNLTRAAIRVLEETDRKVHSMRKANEDISQFDIIIDLDRYSLEGHGCIECIQMYRDIVSTSDSLYREAVKNVFVINAPLVFEAIYPWLAGFLMEEKSREAVKVLGGRASYEPILLQHIDKDQFPNEILN